MTPSCPAGPDWPFAVALIALVVTFGAVYIAAMVTAAFNARTALWADSPPARTPIDPAGLPPLHQPVVDVGPSPDGAKAAEPWPAVRTTQDGGHTWDSR